MNAEQVVKDAQKRARHYSVYFRGAKLDPYRICQLYGVGGGPREQILKKCLRGVRKGDDEMKVVDDIIIAALRWKEMLMEEKESDGVTGLAEKIEDDIVVRASGILASRKAGIQ